jgi:glycosyltransferase involved in cell wall biosynthesis
MQWKSGLRLASDYKVKKNNLHKITLLFISSFFVMEPNEIQEGIGHRYVGLYGCFTKKYSLKYKVYWYAIKEKTLFIFTSQGHVQRRLRTSLPQAIWYLSRKINEEFIVCMAYPYSFGWLGKNYRLFLSNLPITIFSLILLLSLQLRKKCTVLIDVFDLPLETSISYEYVGLENPLFSIMVALSLIIEFMVMKLCQVIFLSKYYVKIISRRYFLPIRNLHVIPSGSFPHLISPSPPRSTGGLLLLYSGSALKCNNFERLIDCVERVRLKGYDVKLVHSGPTYIYIKEKHWLRHVNAPSWLNFIENTLKECDICLVPYPPRGHWNIGHLAKVFDYMSAGKPVLSMNLAETGRILTQFKCGLIAHDWNEFAENIIFLYENRELAARIGNNGRLAVEKYYDYNLNADKLDLIISKLVQHE